MTVQQAATCLRTQKLAAYRADRAAEELQFTGVARKEGNQLEAVNAMYIDTARNYVEIETGTDEDREVWVLIREVETGLRQLIRNRFNRKWPKSADAQIEAILGEQAWKGLLEIRAKSAKSYDRTIRTLPEILDCAYLGQLGELMKSNSSWDLFRDLFRDKRELEDLFRDIVPVNSGR